MSTLLFSTTIQNTSPKIELRIPLFHYYYSVWSGASSASSLEFYELVFYFSNFCFATIDWFLRIAVISCGLRYGDVDWGLRKIIVEEGFGLLEVLVFCDGREAWGIRDSWLPYVAWYGRNSLIIIIFWEKCFLEVKAHFSIHKNKKNLKKDHLSEAFLEFFSDLVSY